MRFISSFILVALVGLVVASPAPLVDQPTVEEREIGALRPWGMQQSGASLQGRYSRPRPFSDDDSSDAVKVKRDSPKPRPWGPGDDGNDGEDAVKRATRARPYGESSEREKRESRPRPFADVSEQEKREMVEEEKRGGNGARPWKEKRGGNGARPWKKEKRGGNGALKRDDEAASESI